ncbi:DMT family transporter [Roseicyclus amphidinii]|jgi:drug/metabolite transporter (DMT)-like permease|uniref:DMT family transporter n=1 Tax=Roseicyclus amphidinii TaxID=3034232 RepID=UPI0024E12835|nr:DMT family transporter [Roseicyclus sp. Amp-Y-6]
MRPAAAPTADPAARPVAGVVWMIVTGLCFVAVTASVKMVGTGVPAAQSAFLRYALGLVFLIPMWPAVRAAALDARTWGLFGLRGVCHAVAVILWFYAMARIPIADVTALNYLNPIYVMLLAVVLLKERLGPWRIGAVGVAFLGTLVIVRPGFREVDIGHLAMLFTAVFMAGSYFMAKVLSGRARPQVVVFMLSVVVPVILAPVAWAVWVPIGWSELGWLALTAAFATAGHYTMTLAFAAAPLTVTQPVTFLQLVWATLLGVVIFGEPADGFVMAGGAMIIAAITLVTWREARRKRAVTPPPDAPGA